jgi:DNA-binding NarL/FixJ family response regulator/class 3 adenylate cyclase
LSTTTILFTKVGASPEARGTSGADVGAAHMAAHLRVCRDVIEANDGRVARTLHDGVMALFGSAYQAALAAIVLQQRHARDDLAGSAPRVGIHVGEAIATHADDPDDVFGLAIMAGRDICNEAAPAQIVASDLARQLVGDRLDVTFTPLGPRRLHGLASLMTLHAIEWAPLPDRPTVRVIVAEDAAIIRAGIVRLLTDEGFDVVADVGDKDALLAAATAERPDLIVTDIRMPPTHTDEGLAAAAAIRREQPDVAVLVLSQHIEPAAAVTLLQGNPTRVGYLLKERVSELDEFVEACRAVAAGGSVIDPLVTSQLMQRRRDSDALDRLTERERDVLSLMAQGRSNHAIAVELSCADKTVETHVRSIFTKLDLAEHPNDHRRVAAVVRWLHNAQ